MREMKPAAQMPRIPGAGGGPGRMPGTMQVEYAEHLGGTLLRIAAYLARERATLAAMLAVVVLGTLCGLWAPSLQSRAIDIISGEAEGILTNTVGLMLGAYLLYSASRLVQGLLSARLSQSMARAGSRPSMQALPRW